jgi:hypothetical protein
MFPLPRRPVLARLLACGLAWLSAVPAPALQAPAPRPTAAAQAAAQPAAQREVIEIEHIAPACVAAGKYSRLAACFRPSGELARARVYFRAAGTADWFYVEMARDMPCYHALLPRVRKDVARIEYYISATDRRSSESRTGDGSLRVTADGRCAEGPLAPVADSGSVVIGSVSGAAPTGFVTGGGLTPLLVAGGVAVVGGGAAAVIVKGGGEPTTTTTTTTTTSTTTTTTSTTSTTTTSTLPPVTTTTTTMACESPNQKPVANITSPSTGPVGNPVQIVATASDPAPGSGVKEVRFSYQYCPGGACGADVAIGSAATAPYSVSWSNQPSCGSAPEDRFKLLARAVDNCGNVSDPAFVDVRSVGRGCFRFSSTQARSVAWQSDLRLEGGRGQVVVDGAEAVFPNAGPESFASALGPGVHRFEATLVDARSDARRDGGAGGTWRFDLSALRLRPGSLRIVAGDVAELAADTVAFRLRARSGERVVLAFEVAGP